MHLLQKRQVGGNKRPKKTNVNKTCSPFPVRIFLCYEEDEYFILNIFLRPYSRELLYKIFFFFFFNVSLHLTIFFSTIARSVLLLFLISFSSLQLWSLQFNFHRFSFPFAFISCFFLSLSLTLLTLLFSFFLFHVRSGFVSRSFAKNPWIEV